MDSMKPPSDEDREHLFSMLLLLMGTDGFVRRKLIPHSYEHELARASKCLEAMEDTPFRQHAAATFGFISAVIKQKADEIRAQRMYLQGDPDFGPRYKMSLYCDSTEERRHPGKPHEWEIFYSNGKDRYVECMLCGRHLDARHVTE